MSAHDRLHELMDAYLDESLDDASRAEFEALLMDSAEARRAFWAAARMHGWMHEACATRAGEGLAVERVDAEPVMPVRTLRRPRWALAAALAIGAALVAAIVVVMNTGQTAQPGAGDGAAPTLAVVMHAEGGVMQRASDGHSGTDAPELAVGQEVRHGAFATSAGRVELAFVGGALAAFEGPCDFRLDGPDRATLTQGRMAVKATAGFVVDTPGLRVTDLGTAFTVDVASDGAARVQVFRGAVRVERLGAGGAVVETIELGAWQSVTAERDGVVERTTASFVDAARVPSDDPLDRLVAHYGFEGDARDTTGSADGVFNASAVSDVHFTAGRRGRAVELHGTADSYIDVPIDATPESMPRLTWGAWVRPIALGGQNREVLSTDVGGFRRVLTLDPRDGVVYSNTKADGHRASAFAGPQRGVVPAGEAVEAGRWIFVAAVYDAAAQTVTVYTADDEGGPIVSRTSTTPGLTGGRRVLRIGNHPQATGEALLGQIDDVFVIADVLTPRQIQQIKDHGVAGSGAPDDPASR